MLLRLIIHLQNLYGFQMKKKLLQVALEDASNIIDTSNLVGDWEAILFHVVENGPCFYEDRHLGTKFLEDMEPMNSLVDNGFLTEIVTEQTTDHIAATLAGANLYTQCVLGDDEDASFTKAIEKRKETNGSGDQTSQEDSSSEQSETSGEISTEEKEEQPPMDLDIKKGGFHKWLGKPEDEPITQADIEKGLASEDPHVRKMAQFAKNAKKWHHEKKD